MPVDVTRVDFAGDEKGAKQLVGFGNALLLQLRTLMRLGGLQSYALTRRYANGAYVSAMSNYGLNAIRCFWPVGAPVVVEPVVPTLLEPSEVLVGTLFASGYNAFGCLGTGHDYTLTTVPSTEQRTCDYQHSIGKDQNGNYYDRMQYVLINYAPGYYAWASAYSWSGATPVYGTVETSPSTAWIMQPIGYPASILNLEDNLVYNFYQLSYVPSGYWLDPYGTEDRRPLMVYKWLYISDVITSTITTLEWPIESIQQPVGTANQDWKWMSINNYVSFIINIKGEMFSAGTNLTGALGLGEDTGTDPNSPFSLPKYYAKEFRQVPGLWLDVATNGSVTWAVAKDKSVWSTGISPVGSTNTFVQRDGGPIVEVVYRNSSFYFVEKVVQIPVIYRVYNINRVVVATLTQSQFDAYNALYHPAGGVQSTSSSILTISFNSPGEVV